MSKYIRYIGGVVCLLCILCLVIVGMALWQGSSFYENSITMINLNGVYEDTICNGMDKKQELLEQEKRMSYTFWGEKRGISISDRENLRQANVNVLTIRGSSEYLIPWGKILQKDDRKGCLIGRKTAEQLFGTHHAENLYIQYENEIFQVRGIVNEPEDILVIQKQRNTDAVLNRITIKKQSGRTVLETVQDFKTRYGVEGEVLRFDFYRGFSWILEMIPGKWSDFSSWKQNIISTKNKWELVESVEKSSLEVMVLKQSKRAVGCFGVACVLVIALLLLISVKAYLMNFLN